MRKRPREIKPLSSANDVEMMWRVEDFARVRARRRMLALESVRLNAELAREKRISAESSTRRPCRAYGSRGRAMVVRWMFAEGRTIEIGDATIGLAVAYLDAIVMRKAVNIGNMQALATACLHIARKFCEVGGDGMDVFETDESVMNKDVEMYVIESLDWRLAIPTAFSFITKFMDKFWIAKDARPVVLNYLESLIVWEESLQFSPSTIACVAILAISRNGLLHPASKEMLLQFVSTQENMVGETSNALRTFHDRLGAVNSDTDSPDSSSIYSSSSGAASPMDDDVTMNMVALDYVEKRVSLTLTRS